MKQEIAVPEHGAVLVPQGMTPEQYDQALQHASAKAQSLAKVIELGKLYTQIGKSKHLRIEGWLTIAEGYGYKADIEWSRPLEGEGFEARAVVVDSMGDRPSHAEAECGTKGDSNWVGRPAFQQRSMAQTRAISKALAARLRWVVVLSGYSPTPAEEMVSESARPAPATQRAEAQKAPSGPVAPAKQQEHTIFFTEAKRAGYSAETALGLLGGVKDWGEWVKVGGTLEVALQRLTKPEKEGVQG